MGSNETHAIFRLEVSVPFVLSWDINAHQPLGWMISSNVVSKCCQPMNHWSLCFSKRLYSEDTDYSVQATQMSKPWWINSELPQKRCHLLPTLVPPQWSTAYNILLWIILQKHRDDPCKHCTLLVSYGWKHQLCTILPARSLHWGCSVLRSSGSGLTGSHAWTSDGSWSK